MKILLIILLDIFCFSAFSQFEKKEYTFSCELNLDYLKTGFNDELCRAPYNTFKKLFYLRLYIENGSKKGTELLSFEIKPSTRTNIDPKNPPYVYLNITMPEDIIPKGSIDLYAEVYENGAKRPFAYIYPIKLEIPKPGFSNRWTSTFFIGAPLKIGYPEQVGISLTLNYLKEVLDTNKISGFKEIIKDIDNFKLIKENRCTIDQKQLKGFYKLLSFIEPYIDENSFLNSEAKKLKDQIEILENSLLVDPDLVKKLDKLGNDNFLDSVNRSLATYDNLKSMKLLYKDYLKFINRIRAYYDQLVLVLFLKAPKFSKTDKTDSLKQQRIFLVAGSSISFFTTPVYNVTVSRPDTSGTVQFESISKINSAISAGIVFNPFSRNKFKQKEDGLDRENKFAIGFFLNYFLSPKNKDIFSKRSFGASIGMGYTFGDFGILATCSFRKARTPRQYFIDQYKGKNLQFPGGPSSFSINDDRIFIDKWVPSIGLTFCYLFRNNIPPSK
ncbi:MAG: hypothetical protein V4556_00540 [Bacteroidota bacterium]